MGDVVLGIESHARRFQCAHPPNAIFVVNADEHSAPYAPKDFAFRRRGIAIFPFLRVVGVDIKRRTAARKNPLAVNFPHGDFAPILLAVKVMQNFFAGRALSPDGKRDGIFDSHRHGAGICRMQNVRLRQLQKPAVRNKFLPIFSAAGRFHGFFALFRREFIYGLPCFLQCLADADGGVGDVGDIFAGEPVKRLSLDDDDFFSFADLSRIQAVRAWFWRD